MTLMVHSTDQAKSIRNVPIIQQCADGATALRTQSIIYRPYSRTMRAFISIQATQDGGYGVEHCVAEEVIGGPFAFSQKLLKDSNSHTLWTADDNPVQVGRKSGVVSEPDGVASSPQWNHQGCAGRNRKTGST